MTPLKTLIVHGDLEPYAAGTYELGFTHRGFPTWLRDDGAWIIRYNNTWQQYVIVRPNEADHVLARPYWFKDSNGTKPTGLYDHSIAARGFATVTEAP